MRTSTRTEGGCVSDTPVAPGPVAPGPVAPGPDARRVLARLCGVDLGDDITPDGAALRTSVAAVATDVIRDDAAAGGSENHHDNDTNSDANGDATGGGPSYLLHCERSSGQY